MLRGLVIAGVLAAAATVAQAERIKDIAVHQGVRSNPLQGYGLVVGLRGTGDNSPLTQRALASLLRRDENLAIDPASLESDNIASVVVRAELPPFARAGQKIDVEVSAIGGAQSLQGGTLLMTPLRGADKQVYAVAHGALIIGGFSAAGEKSSISQNHVTVGRIPQGANVEREEIAELVQAGAVTLNLLNPDFTTAEAVRTAINAVFPGAAEAVDAGTVRVSIPIQMPRNELVSFLDRIDTLKVEVDSPAVVVINERTGTVIVGENVAISTVGISHGNLSIITQEKEAVSQPLPFSRTGTSERIQQTDLTAIEQAGVLNVVPHRVSVQELARALNAMGLTPRDLISIFEALRREGALQARIEVM